MKTASFHKINSLLIALMVGFCQLAISQNGDRNSIKFKGGDLTPVEITNWNNFKLDSYKSVLIDDNYYVLIQFYTIPSEELKKTLQISGVELLDYLPYNSWTAKINKQVAIDKLKSTGIRSISILENRFKLDLDLTARNFPERALSKGGKNLLLQITPLSNELLNNPTVENDINNLGGRIIDRSTNFRTINIEIPLTALTSLTNLNWILWIESPSAKPVTENLPGKTLHRSNVLNDGPRNLTGDGVRIGIWDGGKAGPHLDFLNRLIIRDNVASDDHHTHVAGTMLGAGLIDPFARGMAPKATMYSYDYNGAVSTEVATSLATDQIVISQNSWGYGNGFVNCTTRDPYNSESRAQDLNITNYPYFLHVHSSGNSQSVCAGGWGTTTGKAAKNTLVVANVSSTEAINSSSSFGPTQDGRLKPEISGLGVNVYSTTPNNTYTGGYTGTSMATPGVSGTMAQLYERFRQLNGNANPIASLLKAVACNTAKDLGNAGPDYRFGYGRIDGLKAVRAIENNAFLIGTVASTQTYSQNITIPANATRIKFMLAWTDPAATANANPALVNDLDLVIKNPNNVSTLPWTLDPANPGNVAIRAVNSRDVMEQVTIDNPIAGNYIIEVRGFSVPVGPNQQFAVTWEIESPSIEVTYPNGTEVLTPGASEIIQWNNFGVTGNQTVQYSINNGSSWITLSSTVAANVNQFTWTVPSNITSQALVRVFSGSLTDQSDATFSIIGNSTLSFSPGCNIGEVTFNWTAVTGATSYDLLVLNQATATWNVHTANIVGTSQYVTGLSTTSSSWFSVRARENVGGVIGRRSLAREVSATSVTASSVNATADSISGCGPFSTTLRAILPANSYAVSSIPHLPYTGTATNITTWTGTVDDGFASASLPFTFKFYDTDFTSVFIGTNGFVSFGAGSTAYQQQTIPSATAPNNLIGLAWGDMNPTSGTIGYYTTGVAPNRKFVVSYNSVPAYSGGGVLTGQIVLHETSNIIDLITTTQTTVSAKTQGVENSSGASANITTGRNNVLWSVTTGDAFRYLPISTASFNWTPSTGLSSSTVQYPTLTGLNNTTTYTVVATNGPCIITDTVKINICPSNVTLQLNALIQGMYASGTMPAYLFNTGLSSDPTACDSITVELRNTTTPFALVQSSSSIQNVNGISTHSFTNAVAGGSYYLVIKTRNSIEIWSKLPVALLPSITNSYSFKTP